MVNTRKVFVVSRRLRAVAVCGDGASQPIKHSEVLRFVNRYEKELYERAFFYDVKGDRRYIMKASWDSIHSHTINYEDWEKCNAKP